MDRPTFDFGDVEFRGKSVTLTNTQYRILLRLVAAAPHGVKTPRLHRDVFGCEWRPVDRDPRIRVHIQALRQRLKDAEMPIRIESRNRFGYRAVL